MAWGQIGQNANQRTGGSSDLVNIEGQKRLRLLLPPEGPSSYWFYSISTPADDYKTWLSPDSNNDFFAKNRRIFRVRPTHAGLAWDYDEGAIKILESGNQIWEQIKKLVDAGKDLSGRDIIINKSGAGRSTEYSVVDMDPSPLNVNLEAMEKPDMESRYQAPTYEAVLEDLRQMGFTQPEQIFQTRELGLDEAKNMVVPFGKHKDKTINEVYTTDSQYILFLATKIDREDIKQCARVVANSLMGTQYDVEGLPPSMDEVSFVEPQQDQGQAPGQAQGGQTPPPPSAPAQQTTPPAPPQPQVQTHIDEAGNKYELHNNEWVMVQPAQPTPPPAPPAPGAQQTPPPPSAPAPAGQTAGGFDRQAVIDQINQKFETDPKYKDFMQIINIMKQATSPNEKTAINDFTDEEVQKLENLVL